MSNPIPDFPNFVPLAYPHKEEIKTSLEKLESETSELSLGFIYGYRESFAFQVSKIFGNICIYGKIQNIPSFLPPLGKNKISGTIETGLNFLNEKYGQGLPGQGRINALPKKIADLFLNQPKYKITPDRDDYDYVYKVKDLAELSGKKYQAKRNFVNQFKKKYNYDYRELTGELVSQCLALQEEWCNLRNCLSDESTAQESNCIKEILSNFVPLGLFGAVLLVDGKIQAFTVAETLNPNTAVIHTEKANTDYRGIYQTINNLFCQNELKNYLFVNREQDIGAPGLRKAKLSYHPCCLMEKYNLELKK